MTDSQDNPSQIAVVYYSQRGTTKALVESFIRGVERVDGVTARALSVDEVDAHWQVLDDAQAIVFATPTYIGSVAARYKEFIEKLSNPTWLERLWVGKLAAGITVSSGFSGDKLNCLMQLVIFASQMGMIWVPMPVIGGGYSSTRTERDLNRLAGYLGVMSQANSNESVPDVPPRSDHRTAEIHGEFLAMTARQLGAGRVAHPWPSPLPWSREITIKGA